MKQKLISLSQRYVTALRAHLKRGVNASVKPAVAVGRQAVRLGLETLELARIHERALATLDLANAKNGLLKRAGEFFTAANAPIEQTHRAPPPGTADLLHLQATLGQRTEELASTNRQLQRAVIRRKLMEDNFAIRGKRHQKSLDESLQLQKRLRHLTHRVIAAQEHERKSISRELQDEIAQTLLGINVRLLSLKQQARSNTKGFKNEIANTQRLVLDSARSVRRVARDIGFHQSTPGTSARAH